MILAGRFLAFLFVLSVICCPAGAQNSPPASKKEPIPTVSDPVPHSDSDDQTPPLSPGESSSKQTQIDISPPKDDIAKHPDSDGDGVTEMHSWNPHKAEKDVEVGEFYFKRKNYHAAEDRFREALTFKPGDANATYCLAKALDAEEQYDEAMKEYQEYLKIDSSGNYTSAAKKAIARLEQKSLAQKQWENR